MIKPGYIITYTKDLPGGSPLPIYEKIQQNLVSEPRTWLVTGGAGFIGSNLVKTLLELDQNVRVLDDLSTGYRKNLAQVLKEVGLQKADQLIFHQGNISDPETCLRLCEGVDHVLHQAAQVSVPYSVENPFLNNRSNVDGFLNMLISARDAEVKSFVYASSCAVYGDDPGLPKREEMNCMPTSPYGMTKLMGEHYADLFHRNYGLPAIGLRYFNVFGPRQDPEGAYAAVIPKWISVLLSEGQPVIFGDGEQTRDFCHIDNVIQANILAACRDEEEAFGQVFNVGCGKGTSLNELFKLIRESMGETGLDVKGAQPSHEEPRLGDIRHSRADITKAQKLLGYEPAVSVSEGLQRSIDWYLQNLRT